MRAPPDRPAACRTRGRDEKAALAELVFANYPNLSFVAKSIVPDDAFLMAKAYLETRAEEIFRDVARILKQQKAEHAKNIAKDYDAPYGLSCYSPASIFATSPGNWKVPSGSGGKSKTLTTASRLSGP